LEAITCLGNCGPTIEDSGIVGIEVEKLPRLGGYESDMRRRDLMLCAFWVIRIPLCNDLPAYDITVLFIYTVNKIITKRIEQGM
jgi:hypothetical protein